MADYHRGMRGSDNSPVTVLDLFAGCGGFTQGFHSFVPESAGRKRKAADGRPAFQSVGAVEWDKAAADTYAENFCRPSREPPGQDISGARPTMHRVDITEWFPDASEIDAEVVVGGPPCQGFSGLNRARIGADRNKLWQHFLRIVVAVQPKVFVIENVDRFIRSTEFDDLRRRIGGGDLANYRLVKPSKNCDEDDAKWVNRYVLNAADYGAPQARRRAIVIGVRTDVDGLNPERFAYPVQSFSRAALIQQHSEGDLLFKNYDRTELPWRTVAPIFEETKNLPLEEAAEDGTVKKLTEPVGAAPYRTIDLHFTRNPKPLSIARYRAIPKGGNRVDLRGKFFYEDRTGIHLVGEEKKSELDRLGIECMPLSTPSWDAHVKGSGDVMGRLRLEWPSVTIRTEFYKPEKGRYLHPTEDRPITHLEAALIQGFPKSFLWRGTKTEIARQIGNAVPIPLGRAIAGAIFEYLRPEQAAGGGDVAL